MNAAAARQAIKDVVLSTAARALMTAAPEVAEGVVGRADRWFALLPYLRVEICRRFFAADAERFSVERTRDLWWGGAASANFGVKKSEADFDFAATPYAPLWHHLVDRVIPSLPAAARVLDYGCSTGQWLFALRRRFPSVRYVGYDFNVAAVTRARALAGDDSGIVFHHDPAAIGEGFDLALVCAVFLYNSAHEVRDMLRFLAARVQRLVFLEPLEAYAMDADAARPSTRMLSQPALNHNYLRLLDDCDFTVETSIVRPTAFKTIPVHARLVRHAFPSAHVRPSKRPDRVMVDGVVDYVVIDARSRVTSSGQMEDAESRRRRETVPSP